MLFLLGPSDVSIRVCVSPCTCVLAAPSDLTPSVRVCLTVGPWTRGRVFYRAGTRLRFGRSRYHYDNLWLVVLLRSLCKVRVGRPRIHRRTSYVRVSHGLCIHFVVASWVTPKSLAPASLVTLGRLCAPAWPSHSHTIARTVISPRSPPPRRPWLGPARQTSQAIPGLLVFVLVPDVSPQDKLVGDDSDDEDAEAGAGAGSSSR